MSDGRRPKPTKLKSTVESSGNAGFDVKQFFGKSANLVPTYQNPPAFEDDSTLRIKEFSQTLPIPALDKSVAKPEANRASAQSQPAAKQRSSAKWIDPASAPAPKRPLPEKKSETATVGFVLIAAVCFAVAAYLVIPSGSRSDAAAQSRLSAQQLQERVEFHQKTTGWKLNSERIETQIDNHYQAPKIPFDAQKVKPADMMNGLPLQGEASTSAASRDLSMPVNSSYADARIMYGLQEEQDRIETEKRMKAEYTKEFIENAARDGYAVKIDKFGNVQAKKLSPDEYQAPSSGSTQDSYDDE